MIPKPARVLLTGASLILGGVLTLNIISSATIGALRFATESKRVSEKMQKFSHSSSFSPSLFLFNRFLFWVFVQRSVAVPCRVCRGKGFYICKLCKGNSIIQWSPLFDPVAINPCLCPTCDGNRSVKLFSFFFLPLKRGININLIKACSVKVYNPNNVVFSLV